MSYKIVMNLIMFIYWTCMVDLAETRTRDLYPLRFATRDQSVLRGSRADVQPTEPNLLVNLLHYCFVV